MNEPLDHVERPPLPWREPGTGKTECGRLLAELQPPILTRDEFVEKVRAQGKTRAAMTTCMTCWSTAVRWSDRRVGAVDWRSSPSQVLLRELGHSGTPELDVELRALALLAERHPEEFAALRGADEVAERREAARRRRSRQTRTRRL